ncbi:MAG TPA: hypothetical protein VE869_06125 [Gemmatimonas sp.]|nr:hypothetical protein [Gemmatimonas sp.]
MIPHRTLLSLLSLPLPLLLSPAVPSPVALTPLRQSAMLSFLQGERLMERRLDRVATIKVPKGVKEESLMGARSDQNDRLAFTFGNKYLWASMSGMAHYKQLLVVSIMSPDATAESLARYPRTFRISRNKPKVVHDVTRGSVSLSVTAYSYPVSDDGEPSHIFEYYDRSRRLHIVWHAVVKEVSLASGLQTVEAMATSFRMIADPAAQFTEMSDRPRREAAERARRRELAQRTLAAAGLGGLVPGRPVLKDGVYVEWMSDPEPRYQLFVPLGRVRAVSAQGGFPPRPTPPLVTGGGGQTTLAGSIGWRAFREGEWEFSNNEDAYLPLEGLSKMFAARYNDPGEVFYYYVATVRVEEEDTDDLLTSLQWFTRGVPEVQRLWREGALVRGTTPLPPRD